MRLDKFLKVSRIIKRRTLAKEVCDQGRVFLNGQPAKASSPIRPGDVLSIRFGQKELTVRVLEIKENPSKEEAGSLYEIVEEKRIPVEEEKDLPLW